MQLNQQVSDRKQLGSDGPCAKMAGNVSGSAFADVSKSNSIREQLSKRLDSLLSSK
jgi:hypothetical protein